jgi:choline dehydrogenase-like flavoprotein
LSDYLLRNVTNVERRFIDLSQSMALDDARFCSKLFCARGGIECISWLRMFIVSDELAVPGVSAPTMRGFIGNQTARACVEALFPPHPQLGQVDIQALLAQLDLWFGQQRWSRTGYGALLASLNWQCRMEKRRTLAQLSLPERQAWLHRVERRSWQRPLLDAVALPLKAAYLGQPRIRETTGQRDLPQAAVTEPARWQRQIRQPSDLMEQGTIEADVAIIGSGAGGAIAAYELASRGLAVIILEEGPYLDRSDFLDDPLTQVYKLYRGHGLTGAIGNTVIPIPLGRVVGGTTLINSGTCLRTPGSVLAQWQAEGLTALSADQLTPYFEQVEVLLQVQAADRRYLGAIADVIGTGAGNIGLHQNHPLMRNASGCDGQGLCQFGCPTGAKQSTNVSVIPRALERGAVLLPQVRAERLLHERQRITGLQARDLRSGKRFTLKVREVVVAAGSLLTPTLLKRSGVRNRWLGRNLSIHPAGAVTAWFPGQDFGNSKVIPQGFGVSDMQEEGIIFEGATPPLSALGLMIRDTGPEFQNSVARYRETAFFGFMIRDTARGRVLGRIGGLPWVSYHMNDTDFALFRRGLDTLARIYLAAGAREVRFPGARHLPVMRSTKDLETFWQQKRRPRDFLISAYHPLGTARIAANDKQGVCDSDHRVFGWQGLTVMDGAAVPSALGANPQVTIMTLALRAARRLADRWSEDASAP